MIHIHTMMNAAWDKDTNERRMNGLNVTILPSTKSYERIYAYDDNEKERRLQFKNVLNITRHSPLTTHHSPRTNSPLTPHRSPRSPLTPPPATSIIPRTTKPSPAARSSAYCAATPHHARAPHPSTTASETPPNTCSALRAMRSNTERHHKCLCMRDPNPIRCCAQKREGGKKIATTHTDLRNHPSSPRLHDSTTPRLLLRLFLGLVLIRCSSVAQVSVTPCRASRAITQIAAAPPAEEPKKRKREIRRRGEKPPGHQRQTDREPGDRALPRY